MRLSLLIYLASFFFLVGCVTKAVQTEALLQQPLLIPQSKRISNVPFINQAVGHCGPATLTMAMQWTGLAVDVNQIASQVYTPGAKGSFQSDMISASRRQGLMAIPINDLLSLLTEVAAGHPVIIFENLALSWLPQWHYALVHGYDLQKQVIIMHSGPDANYHWDLAKFERSWMLGNYWGLVVIPAGELSATGNELAHVTAAVGLEKAQKNTEAEKSYRKILQKWPTSLVALIGLGNLVFQKGQRNEAVQLLRRATKAHPQSKAAWHNLAVAEAN